MKSLSTLDVVAPHGSPVDRILVLGLGRWQSGLAAHDWLKAGGAAGVENPWCRQGRDFPTAGRRASGKAAADFALGMEMNAYSFDTYKTTKKDDDDQKGPRRSPSR